MSSISSSSISVRGSLGPSTESRLPQAQAAHLVGLSVLSASVSSRSVPLRAERGLFVHPHGNPLEESGSVISGGPISSGEDLISIGSSDSLGPQDRNGLVDNGLELPGRLIVVHQQSSSGNDLIPIGSSGSALSFDGNPLEESGLAEPRVSDARMNMPRGYVFLIPPKS